MSVNISGNNHKITTGDKSPIIINTNNNKVSENIEKFYQKWWFISFIVGCMGGSIIGYNLNSFVIGLSSIVIIILLVLFLNPKRRFMRVGLIVLSMGTLNVLPKVTALLTISKDNFIIFEQNTSSILGVFLILLSGYLFYLDSKQK